MKIKDGLRGILKHERDSEQRKIRIIRSLDGVQLSQALSMLDEVREHLIAPHKVRAGQSEAAIPRWSKLPRFKAFR